MKLYGTVTSPYVRRVRVLGDELGLEMALVDTSTDEGQAALRRVTPLWKVPTVELDGEVIIDSHVIIDRLVARHGLGPLRPMPETGRARETRLQVVVDGALDSAINAFYLRREGVDPAEVPYLKKQLDRAASALAYAEAELAAGALPQPEAGAFGLTELALITALDWMAFRGPVPLEGHPRLAALRAAHAGRPSLARTAPR